MMKLKNLIALGILGVLTLGVGVGLTKTNNVFKVDALSNTVTYTVEDKSSVSVEGTAPNSSNVEFSQTYTGNAGQMTANNSTSLLLSNLGGIKITNFTLSMKSNSSKGEGSLSYKLNGLDTVILIETAKFNTSSWYGSWSTSYVDIIKSVDISDANELEIIITATENSLYIQSYTIEWESNDAPSANLASIDISGDLSKKEYFIGDEISTDGLTATAYFDDESSLDVTNNVTWSINPSIVSSDTTSVIINASLTINEITKTDSITITGITVSKKSRYYFKDGSDENGGFQEWESAYATHALQYDGINVEWSSVNKQSSSVSITDMPVSKECDTTFQSTKTFKYLEVGFKQWTTKTQTIELKVNNTVVETLDFPNGGTSITWAATDEKINEIVVSATDKDNHIGWEYFVVELGEDAASNYTQEAATWAKSFNENLGNVCVADGSTDLELLNTAWSSAKLSYDTLSVEAKEYLKTVTLETSDNTDITNAISLYDYVYKKYNTQLTDGNFLQRDLQVVSPSITNVPSDNTMLIIIVVISILSVSSIALFAISKRKAIRK